MKRIAWILLIAILAGLTSCGDDAEDEKVTDQTTTSAQEETTEEGPKPTLPDVKYDYTFTFYTRGDLPTSFMVEEATGEIMDDALYGRMTTVSELLGVEFANVKSSDEFGMDAKNAIIAGDDSYDVIVPHGRQAFGYVEEGLTLNWLTDLEYIDLDAPWWSQDAKDSFTIAGNLGLMIGDIDHGALGMAKCTFFNQKIFDEYSIDYPYELVRQGKWTFDKVVEISRTVTEDLNGDAKYELDKDQFGFASTWWGTPINVITTAGVRICDKNAEGLLEISLDSERTVEVFDKFFNAMDNENGMTIIKQDNSSLVRDAFIEGRLAFCDGLLNAAQTYRDMNDDFGIIPCAKFDESVEGYPSLVDAYCGLLLVPITASDASRTSAVLEAMAYYGWRDVVPAYYDIALSVKFARDDDSVEMLDIIRENRCFDIGYYCGSIPSELNSIGYNLTKSNDHNFASYYASIKDSAQAKIDEINQKYMK